MFLIRKPISLDDDDDDAACTAAWPGGEICATISHFKYTHLHTHNCLKYEYVASGGFTKGAARMIAIPLFNTQHTGIIN